MKVSELKAFLKRMPDDAEIDVLIETEGDKKCQYQFPLNDCAYSKHRNLVILMHEKWLGIDNVP